MKSYTTVKVEAEFSASHVETFFENVPAMCSCPVSQAIANVREKLKARGIKYPYHVAFRAH